MFAVCGVSDDKFRGVCLVVDKLDKVIIRSRWVMRKGIDIDTRDKGKLWWNTFIDLIIRVKKKRMRYYK